MEDPTQTIPDDIEGFEEGFKEVCEKFEIMAKDLYTTIATSIDPASGKSIHDDDAMRVVLDCVRMGSSVSMIDYQPVTFEETEITPGRDPKTEDYHIPSATHCDTGFLTMIMCSNVPGLQIKDRFVFGNIKKHDVEIFINFKYFFLG